jgi:hypothetical protein
MSTEKSSKFTLHYSKTKLLNTQPLENSYNAKQEDFEYDYNPFRLTQMQNYNPVYSQFFELTSKNYDTISLNHTYSISSLDTIVHTETKETVSKPVFIKYSPLLDPLRYMIGKYDVKNNKTTVLPDNTLNKETTLPKLLDYNNASYVDNFFCYLTSQLLHKHRILNCLDYYGSFLGIQEKYKANIIDDLDYLQSSSYFTENLGKQFIVAKNEKLSDFTQLGSRGNKHKLCISKGTLTDLDCISIVEEIEIEDEKGSGETSEELVYENAKRVSETKSERSSSTGSSNNSELNYSSDDDNHDEEDDDYETCSDEEEDEEDEGSFSGSDLSDEDVLSAYIHNFPVQLICLEKCDGTMDELFLRNKINKTNGSSILLQVIFTLLIFQKAFHFTHNDLHTNNIMYVKTEQEFVYYKYGGKWYKVPTYGKIFKIIDFGRSIYKFQGKQFCSDSFAPGGDAVTQYNFEPFMNKNKARLEPNYSFDLSRLGTSIYDFVIDEENPDTMDPLQQTIYRWCTDDNGKNVLYKKNGEERYPNFKLYKMIVRTVHEHTPENQLQFDYFNQYEVKEWDGTSTVIDIDALPCYI